MGYSRLGLLQTAHTWANTGVVCSHALGLIYVTINHLAYNLLLVKVSFGILRLSLACVGLLEPLQQSQLLGYFKDD